MTYSELNALLTGRNKQKKLQPNTYAERRGRAIVIRLHQTDILTFYHCGTIVVTSGGWKTPTTKDRLNNYLPVEWSVLQRKGEWFWWRPSGEVPLP